MKINKKISAYWLTLLSFCTFNNVQAKTQTDLPNIVIIMADDVGPGDISSHHRKYTKKPALVETPTIDQLAMQGISFSDAHSPTALCSPTRYSVMSGNLPHRSYAPWGVWQKFRPSPFTKNDATLGRVAKQAGYNTGFIGKWHLGGDFYKKNSKEIFRGYDMAGEVILPVDLTKWVDGAPRNVGYDYDFTVPSGVQGPIYLAYENSVWYPLDKNSKIINVNKKTALEPKTVSDKGPGMGDSHWNTRNINMLIANKAKHFIRSNANKKEPFMLTYWTPSVHIPHMPPESMAGEKMKDTTINAHLDMMKVLDKEVEIIINTLKETDQFENTLLIFTSDNGGLPDGKAERHGHNSSGEWSGHKNKALEGGHRVPLIAVWPGKIKANTTTEIMASGSDLVATLAALVNIELEDNQALDSWNLLPTLLGKNTTREQMILQAGTGNEYIYREGDWKLIIQSNHKMTKMDPKALFNLRENPKELETANFVNSPNYQEKIKTMLEKYLIIRETGLKNPAS